MPAARALGTRPPVPEAALPVATFLIAGLLVAAACNGGGTGPEGLGPCTVDSVEVDVSSGTTPTFTWTPACLVFALLVEQEASDRWLLQATGEGIASGVRYGTVPRGAVAPDPAIPLQAGTTYEVILFRGTEDDAIIIAIEEFTP